MNGYSVMLGCVFGGHIYKSVELYEPQRTSSVVQKISPRQLNLQLDSRLKRIEYSN